MNDIRAGTRAWTPERISSASKAAAAVVAVGLAAGLFAILANIYLMAAAIGVVLLTGLVAWKFESALVIYAVIAFVPWGQTPSLATGGSGVGKGLYVSEVMLGFLLAVWFARHLAGALPKPQIRSGFGVPLALYLCYCILNVVHSFIFWDTKVDRVYQYPQVNVAELGLHVLSVGAFVMMATTVSSRKWLKWCTAAVLLPGLYQLLNSATGNKIPISAAWWPLIIFLPACYAWSCVTDKSYGKAVRTAWAVVVGLALLTILVRNVAWVSGWFGLMCGLGGVTLIRSRRLFVVMLLILFVLTLALWPVINEKVFGESKTGGDYDRFALLAGAWKYAVHFPLGVGLGNYRSYNSYHYGEEWGTTSYTSAHGTYSQHLAETGIPGLLLFLSVLVCGFRWMLRAYLATKSRFSRTYLLAALGQLVGIASASFVGDYLIPTYHNGGIVTFSATVYSWLIWGLAVAHVRLDSTPGTGSEEVAAT